MTAHHKTSSFVFVSTLMEVKDFQRKIADFVAAWDRKRESSPDEKMVFIHLVEEIGELASQYVSKESRKDQYSKEELDDGIADALMQLVKLADQRGIDIEDLALKTMEREGILLKN